MNSKKLEDKNGELCVFCPTIHGACQNEFRFQAMNSKKLTIDFQDQVLLRLEATALQLQGISNLSETFC